MKDLTVSWPNCVRFVRQLNHDIRNHLNAIELQAALLNEIAPEGEVKDEVKRLRGTLSTVAVALQKLSTRLSEPKPNPIPYRAADLMSDLQKKFEWAQAERAPRVKWEIGATNESVDVDPQLLEEVLWELIENAFQFSPKETTFALSSEIRGSDFIITLREPKPADGLTTSDWGREPLKNPRHGHYGVGLPRVRAIIEGHGGKFSAAYDDKAQALVTTILLPASAAAT